MAALIFTIFVIVLLIVRDGFFFYDEDDDKLSDFDSGVHLNKTVYSINGTKQ